MPQVEVHKRSPLAATLCLPLIGPAIREFPEMQGRPFDETFVRVARSIEENERVELIATQYGETVGGLVLVLEDDQHVGPCCSVQWAYVPAGNPRVGATLYRTALRLARRHRVPYLAYTKRVGVGRFSMVYRKLQQE